MNEQTDNLRKIANQIFDGEITWEEARKKASIADKTLREHIIALCKEDTNLMEKFKKYSQKKSKHQDINVPAVIISMVRQGKSYFDEAAHIGITKESLRSLIKKENDPNLEKLLKIHSDVMIHKRTMHPKEKQETEQIIEKYISENPEYIDSEKIDTDSLNAEKRKIKDFLNFVESEKKKGKSELQIARENNFGPARIRRARIRLEKIDLLVNSQKNKDNNLEEGISL